jgi:hypothetical protein
MGKMVLSKHICTVCRGWKMAINGVHLPGKNVINMIWVLVLVFWLAKDNDWSRWFAISSLPSIFSHNFSFIWGVPQKEIAKLGRAKYFSRVPYWAPLGYSKCRTVHSKASYVKQGQEQSFFTGKILSKEHSYFSSFSFVKENPKKKLNEIP